ncbi:MAG: hypothetical protein JWQ62_838 [Lacunisphaera sp.]|nr:hypothetical protein [Lacunisphaera sp.]
MPTTLRLRCLAALSIIPLLVFASGCASDSDGPRAAGPRRKPPTPLAGHENFFAGQILAEIHVGADGMPEPGSGDERGSGNEHGSSGGGGRGRRGGGGGGGGRRGGGGGGMSGDIGDSMPLGEGAATGPRPRPMGGRPVMIHLRFTNHGATAATVQILDFVSPLGNFVVRPDHVAVEPGQSIEVEPMSSELAGEIGGTEATLRLRLGSQTEKKTFELAAVPPAPASPEK